MFTSTEGLLQTVRQRGWTSEDQRVFLQRYGPLLRRALLGELGRRFGPTALRGLSRYLKALEQGEASGPGEMSGAFWDLACDVWQAVCLEIFKAKGNTMTQYARYCDKSAQTGKAPMKFESFLWGLVNLKVRQQIPRHREIFAPVVSPADDDPNDGDPWEERLPSEDDAQVEELALADEIDLYFECAAGVPENLKLCLKGTWNERMLLETILSMLTVVCRLKHLFHRTAKYVRVHLAYLAAMLNVLLQLNRHLHPEAPLEDRLLHIAQYSL